VDSNRRLWAVVLCILVPPVFPLLSGVITGPTLR